VTEHAVPLAAWAALGYTPNAWQWDNVHTKTHRFIAGCTCRQCGKTMAMSAEIHNAMTRPADPISGKHPYVGVMAVAEGMGGKELLDEIVQAALKRYHPG